MYIIDENTKYITISIPFIKCANNQKIIERVHADAILRGCNFCPNCGKCLLI